MFDPSYTEYYYCPSSDQCGNDTCYHFKLHRRISKHGCESNCQYMINEHRLHVCCEPVSTEDFIKEEDFIL